MDHGMHQSHIAAPASHDRKAVHGKHQGHSIDMFRRKFWWSLLLSAAVVWYSDIWQALFGFTAPSFPGAKAIPLVLGSTVFFYGGWVFLQGAVRELKGKQPGMMTLIAMAIGVAFVYSLYAEFATEDMPLWWELTTLITIMLLGHWMEMRAVQAAQGALRELAKLLPDSAELIKEGKTVVVPLAKLQAGDIILVRPGGKVAADGTVIEGWSEVDESMVSGESKPVGKAVGQPVIAGTVNGDGSLKVRVDKIGENTFLSGVMRMVAEAENSKSRLQLLSDQAAYYLTLVALVSGALTFLFWTLNQSGVDIALQRTVAVLVIACPHALGLAIPLVASISTNIAAKNGLFVKQRLALEAARNVNLVIFDKTGTLTKGEYGVDTVVGSGGFLPQEALELAAAVNSHSEHPLAKALAREALRGNLRLPEAKDFQRIPGKGSKAKVMGREVLVGNRALLEESGAPWELPLLDQATGWEKQGKTAIFVIADKQLIGSIALADTIREESRQAVTGLKAMGIKVAMITGDAEGVAAWVAKELGIQDYFSKVLPDQKSAKVKLFQDKGMKVAMVGDGINDAPALTQADLGVAIGAGTNVAIESAGVILAKNDPRDVAKVIRLSKATFSKMVQNLFWATGYNALAIPLAAGVLAFAGFVLQPAVAALFMSISTVIVALNAAMLKRQVLE